jgi:type 1 fimbria pilin
MSNAFAGPTAQLTITGTIAPVACVPSFAGGGAIDFGKIATSSLKRDERTGLKSKTVAYNLECDAPVAMGVSWKDERAGTAAATGKDTKHLYFGLGKGGGANIGSYTLLQDKDLVRGDAEVVDLLHGVGGASWALASSVTDGFFENSDGASWHSFAVKGSTNPGAFTKVSGSLIVTPYIAPSKDLDVSKEIVLDGLATMEVRYL